MICDQCETVAHCMKNGCVPKTTAQRKPLTDEQIDSIVAMSCKKDSSHLDAERVARATEAAHGICAFTELKENT